MDDSFNELIYFPVWPLPETAVGAQGNCLVGALPLDGGEGQVGANGGRGGF